MFQDLIQPKPKKKPLKPLSTELKYTCEMLAEGRNIISHNMKWKRTDSEFLEIVLDDYRDVKQPTTLLTADSVAFKVTNFATNSYLYCANTCSCDYLMPGIKICEDFFEGLYYQHDGAPAHYAVDREFDVRII